MSSSNTRNAAAKSANSPASVRRSATCGSTIHADDHAALRTAARRHVAQHQEG